MRRQAKVLLACSIVTAVLIIIAIISCIVAYGNDEDSSGQITAGWGDSGGGRPSYTIDEINGGALGDKIVFNSISDGKIGNEKDFVGAQNVIEIEKEGSFFEGSSIEVEDGEEYLVRLYVHNNSLYGEDSVAENVRVAFSVPWGPAKNIPINGFIFSDNATPDTYWDGVVLTSDRNFHLEYIEGSAEFENNGFAAESKPLSDEVVFSPEGTLIGYNNFDGKIPGCFAYDCVVTIRVRAVFEGDFLVESNVRLAGEKKWSYQVEAKVGDRVEYQIQYKNTNKDKSQNDVFIRDILPENLRYIEGSTVLYNVNFEAGMTLDEKSDTLITTGINIGSYAAGSNAFIRFTAEVIDVSLEEGSNMLVNWAKGTVDDTALTDYAVVMVNKE